jgi:hypothetical protein
MGPVCDVNEPRKDVSLIPGVRDSGETLNLRRVRDTRIGRPGWMANRRPAGLIKRLIMRHTVGCSAACRRGEHPAEALKSVEQVIRLWWISAGVPGGRAAETFCGRPEVFCGSAEIQVRPHFHTMTLILLSSARWP